MVILSVNFEQLFLLFRILGQVIFGASSLFLLFKIKLDWNIVFKVS